MSFKVNRIDAMFRRFRKARKKALIGYVTAGFPDKKRFATLIKHLEKAGLDLLEIGVPFSDPIADGPTIQHSSQKALENGVALNWIFQTITSLRRHMDFPMVLMTYSNPIVAFGLKRFFVRAEISGIDGLIIPDLAQEEGKPFETLAAEHHIHMIYLAAPTTSPERLRRIANATRGFLYAVSLTGVTGARGKISAGTDSFLRRVRHHMRKPVAAGFGVSTPEQIRHIRRWVDGVIVGSALIERIECSKNNAFRTAVSFIGKLQDALNPETQNRRGRRTIAHVS